MTPPALTFPPERADSVGGVSAPNGERGRILIVEDNDTLARGLANNLEVEGYEVHLAGDAASGADAVQRHSPDLVILDLMLPDADGYRLLVQLRERAVAIRILILTARTEEADKVLGFRYGADDYVTKPFGLLELLGRVRALMRRSSVRSPGIDACPSPTIYRFGDIEIFVDRHTVTRRGIIVSLRPKEFDLLAALARRNGAIVSKEQLLREVWGYREHVVSRTVDTHISEIRRKLEDDPSDPRYIITLRKIGYRLGG